jgi:hypothetical protein
MTQWIKIDYDNIDTSKPPFDGDDVIVVNSYGKRSVAWWSDVAEDWEGAYATPLFWISLDDLPQPPEGE